MASTSPWAQYPDIETLQSDRKQEETKVGFIFLHPGDYDRVIAYFKECHTHYTGHNLPPKLQSMLDVLLPIYLSKWRPDGNTPIGCMRFYETQYADPQDYNLSTQMIALDDRSKICDGSMQLLKNMLESVGFEVELIEPEPTK